jgi:hypothetical protein
METWGGFVLMTTTSSQGNHQTPYDPVLLIMHELAKVLANRLDVIHEMAFLHD